MENWEAVEKERREQEWKRSKELADTLFVKYAWGEDVNIILDALIILSARALIQHQLSVPNFIRKIIELTCDLKEEGE